LVKNHGTEAIPLNKAGVALAFAEIKKVHSRAEGVLKPVVEELLEQTSLNPGESIDFTFSLQLPPNCQVSDKRSSYFLTYGQQSLENHLQLKVEPLALFGKMIGLLDTFYRFKLKEFKAAKMGVEYKLIPPTSRELANLETLGLTFQLKDELLVMHFEFQVKKLDTSSVTTKLNKETVKIVKELTPREYSLGREHINQDQLLKVMESVLSEVKMKGLP
jgi:hypothetical protein